MLRPPTGRAVKTIFILLVIGTLIYIHRGAVVEWTHDTGLTYWDFYSHATLKDLVAYHTPRILVAAGAVMATIILVKWLFR